MTRIWRLWWAWFFFAACAGPGGSHNPDAGADAGDGRDGDDGRDDGDGLPTDVDPGEGFGLLVPAGAKVCTYASAGDVLKAYQKAARVTLKEGLVKLSRENDRLEYDLVEKIELGPERAELSASGPGAFVRTLQGTAQNGTYSYRFEQLFDAGGRDFTLALRFDFKVENGRSARPVIILDAATLGIDPWNVEEPFVLSARLDDPQDPWGQQLRFAACQLERLERAVIDISLAGGDRLQFSVRCPDHSMTFIILSTVCPCLLQEAALQRGASRREARDFFRLAFVSWNHCNMSQEMLAVFDQPLEGVYGVRVPGGPDSEKMHTVPSSVVYLDAELKEKETRQVISWKTY